jgi:hypothetical protein
VTDPDPPRRPLMIKKQPYYPTLDDVLKAMYRVPTTPIPPGGWYAVVRRKRYPLKQVVARTLGLRGQDFSLPHSQAFARYVGVEFGQAPGTFRHPTASGT